MSVDEKTIKIYDARASDYAHATKDLDEYDHLCAFTKAMPKDAHVLDLGCGPGLYAAFIGASGTSVDAVDASSEMVNWPHSTPMSPPVRPASMTSQAIKFTMASGQISAFCMPPAQISPITLRPFIVP